MIVAVSPDSRKFPFPPAIPIVALVLSWIIGRLWPIEANWPTWTQWAGWILFTVPFLFAIWAVITFRRNFTVVDPRGQVTTIVTTGPFQYSRNPMYVTLLIVYTGSALAFRLPWALVLLLPVFLLLQFVVIIPEEKYLEASFGEEYIRYKRRVRRWL
jgi:protein-S-isoprenylcysteine O-methyltransferase Ste14